MVKTLLQLLFAYSEFGYPVVICYVQLYVLYLKKNCPSFFQLNFKLRNYVEEGKKEEEVEEEKKTGN